MGRGRARLLFVKPGSGFASGTGRRGSAVIGQAGAEEGDRDPAALEGVVGLVHELVEDGDGGTLGCDEFVVVQRANG